MQRVGFRASGRHQVRIKVFLLHQSQGWERPGWVVNLGAGGACVELPELLSAGDAVALAFSAPTLWDPLLVPGRVAWFRAASARGAVHTAGVAFTVEQASHHLALFDLIETLDFGVS